MKSIELRTYILSSLFLTIGLVLHLVVPAAFLGVKFDFMLPFLFLAVVMNPTLKNTFMVGIIGGILTAYTTQMPGGQLPNMIDKVITSLLVYLLYKATNKLFNKFVFMIVIGFIGTLISGTIFLLSGMLLGVIPTFFEAFVLIVLPTGFGNMILSPFLYYIYNRATSVSRPVINVQR